MGPVRIGSGGSGGESGAVTTDGKLLTLTLAGSVIGGLNSNTGIITSGNGTLKIGRDIRGGLSNLMIGGLLIGGGPVLSGAIGIGCDIVGRSASGTAGLEQSGYIRGRRIGSLQVGGSIRATNDIGSIKVKGSIIGNSTNPVFISARGQATPTATADMAIDSITVGGRVERAKTLGGYVFGGAENADVQIGAVTVVGALAGDDGFFGNGDTNEGKINDPNDDAGNLSRIKSVTIGGHVLAPAVIAHFGIVAENVVAVKIRGTTIPLLAGNGNGDVAIGITGNFRINEI